MELTVPTEVARLVEGSSVIGQEEQAFTLLTVDAEGFPHVCLLSRTELATSGQRQHLWAVVRGTTTQSNLTRSRQAALIAVAGTASHQLKLRVSELVEEGDLVAARFEVTWHRADDVGLALRPTTFVPTRALSEHEAWDRVTALLEGL